MYITLKEGREVGWGGGYLCLLAVWLVIHISADLLFYCENLGLNDWSDGSVNNKYLCTVFFCSPPAKNFGCHFVLYPNTGLDVSIIIYLPDIQIQGLIYPEFLLFQNLNIFQSVFLTIYTFIQLIRKLLQNLFVWLVILLAMGHRATGYFEPWYSKLRSTKLACIACFWIGQKIYCIDFLMRGCGLSGADAPEIPQPCIKSFG